MGDKGAMLGDKGTMLGDKGAMLGDIGAMSVINAQKLADFGVFEKRGKFMLFQMVFILYLLAAGKCQVRDLI